MIRIERLQIRNFRGIRDLDLEVNGRNLVVYGPNGSGKSGVVDAIEFALAGRISRISGPGTKGITVSRHGPHVDYRDKARDSSVTITVQIPGTQHTATLTRSPDAPDKPTILPDTDSVRALFQRAMRYPEVVLSRRDIIKYIIVEASKRADQVQALLKLERLQEFRAAFRTATNSLSRKAAEAQRIETVAREQLKRSLSIEDLGHDPLKDRVNELRTQAGAPALARIDETTDIDHGLTQPEESIAKSPSKASILSDLTALDGLYPGEATLCAPEALASVFAVVGELRADSDLRRAVDSRQLITLGLECIEDGHCPLCGTDWDENKLREYLQTRFQKAERGAAAHKRLEDAASNLALQAKRLETVVAALAKKAERSGLTTIAVNLEQWANSVVSIQQQLGSPVESVDALSEATVRSSLSFDEERRSVIDNFKSKAEAMTASPPITEARDTLLSAKLRLDDARKAQKAHARAKRLADRAERVMATFNATLNEQLEELFDSVQSGLAGFYQHINADDEASFEARLTYTSGSADLDVGFFGRGFFPPAAYHSEGHQDAMGLCLYLALMKQLLGDDFQLSVLDDVVMSVDTQHRKSICSLIRSYFPDTQFIITTHDKIWMHQMRAAGVARGRQLLVFGQWNVDTGPLIAIAGDTWRKIDSLLENDDVPGAAAALRYYVEYSARELGGQLGAKVTLRPDGDYELNDLLPALIARWDDILKRAVKAARSWKRPADLAEIEMRQELFREASQEFRGEQWAVNPAVHFNDWATFSPDEFARVTDAYKKLLGCLECSKCESWAFLERRGAETSSARCPCGEIDLNLLAKK